MVAFQDRPCLDIPLPLTITATIIVRKDIVAEFIAAATVAVDNLSTFVSSEQTGYLDPAVL